MKNRWCSVHSNLHIYEANKAVLLQYFYLQIKIEISFNLNKKQRAKKYTTLTPTSVSVKPPALITAMVIVLQQ